RGVEADPVANAGFLHPPFNIVEENRAGRIGGNLLAEMLVEGVVRELQPFLGAIGPEVAVHGTVNWLAILVQSRPPGVVPQTAPITLLLEADDLRDGFPLSPRRLESPHLC